MSRLAGKMVAGFYPTPPTVTALLATLLVAPRGGRLLDPCAGLGVFAATLARDLGLESYGVEINDTRAGEAATPLDHLLHTDALKLMMTHESVGLLALNPPYDYDDEVRRLEHAFLLKTTPYVQPDGVLALLVPQQRLSVSASYLTAHYTDIRVWRFPDEEYQAYRQVVLLARKKSGPERDAAAARALIELAKGELEPLTAGSCPPYTIPRAGAAPLFAASELDPLAAAREAATESWPALAGRLWPREAPRIRPLMPMKKGHVAQFAVAGLLSNVVLHDEAGDPFVVKGQAEKATVVKVTDGEDSVTRTERDVLQTRLTLLDVRRRRFIAVDTGGAIRGEATARGDGEDLEELEDQEQAVAYPAPLPLDETMGLDTFLERFKESITARILADYRPLYTPLQRDLYADRLRLLKRRLMGAQSDVVRAVALALRSGRRGVFVNGKMGTGKCLHPATRVSVNGVVRTMEEVWEAYAGTPVFDGDGEIALPREPLLVPSLNEESGRVEMRPVEHLWRQRVREPLRRVRLVDGRTIRTTMAHKFLTPSGWTSEIAPGSYIAVPRREPAMPDAPAAPLDARFMAWLVAEGHERRSRRYPRSAFMEIAQVDRAVLESLVDPARALGMTGLRVADPRYGRSAATLRATATRALPALAAAGYAWGLRSAAKRVPTCIMQADDRAARDFLRAYVDAEGSISSEPQRATLEITTASVGMAHDLCTLLRRVGVYSRIASKAAAATNGSRIVRTYFRVVVSGSALRAFARHVGCGLPRKAARLQAIVERPGNDNIDTIYIADLIGAAKRVTGLSQGGSGNLFSTIYVSGRQPSMNRQTAERLADLLARAGSAEAAHLATRLRSRIDGDVFYVRVASVEEEDYEGDVYDLHVPETHNFTADHVVVHNTTVSLAAAWCHGACSILVLCPPHLTRKWQREVLATVPGARVGIATTPADLHAILDTPADRWHQGPLVTIISRERAKLRYATVPCAATRTVRVQDDDGALVTRTRLSCPDCGRLLVDKEGVPLTMAILKRRKHYCPDCRAALWQADRTGPRRVALADYIKAQLPRAYDLLIADEVHQFKGRGTAQGFALATLAGLIPQTLALTGTLFNGLSTSLFYLMYRLIPEIRAEFGVNDETAWAARYGILERVTVYRENEEAREDGAQSKCRSGNTRVEEKPGIMPALVVRLVEHTVFMNLADVAEGLPPYDEGFTLYDMTDAQASCYAALYRTLHDELIAALHSGGAGKLLGAYLQKLLTYADTCWDPRWTDEPAVGRQLDAAEVYPKEQALADYCRRERGRARRVLVYVKHVGERDVTARLARVLTDAGCRVAVLKSDTVPSDEREEWFERQVKAGVDVVITNPTLVETGLDLLAFPSIRFHEIEYDTNTLSQATKRSWRIGQDRPVEVTFTGYRGTIQTNGLARVASKLRASYQADGDLMSGGLADFGDDGDFFRDLARSIACGEGTGGDGLEALYAEARAAAADGGGEILTDEEREARERVAVAVVTEAGASASAGVTVDLDHLRAAYYAAGKPKGVSDAQLSFFDVDLAG